MENTHVPTQDLDTLLEQVTAENIHPETFNDAPHGREIF
jgi:hypothetical protein